MKTSGLDTLPDNPERPTGIGLHYLRYSTTNLLVMVAGFISFPLLTRLLDHAQFGVLKYYDSWLLIGIALVKLGAQHAIVRFYPHGGSVERMRHFGTNLVLVPMALSAGLWAVIAVCMTLWQWVRGSEFTLVFWCVVLITPVVAFSNIIQMIIRARERSDIVMATRVSGKWLELALVIAFVVLVQRSALSVYAGRLVAALVLFGWFVRWLRQNVLFARSAIDLSAVRDAMRYALPMMANELASVLLVTIDRVILKEVTGDFVIVGIYAIGYALAGQLNVFLNATLSEAFIPVVTRSYGAGGASAVHALKERILLPMTYVVVAIVALLIVSGEDVLVALSGQEKAASAQVFVVVGTSLALFALFDIMNFGMLLKLQSMKMFLITLAATMVNIGMNFALIPHLGYMGAAWATAISYAVLAVFRFIACPKGLARFPGMREVGTSVACAGLLVFIAHETDLLGASGPWARLAVAGTLFSLLYVLPVLSLDARMRWMIASFIGNNGTRK